MPMRLILALFLLIACNRPAFSQDETRLDSLIHIYEALERDTTKVHAAIAVFREGRRAAPELALGYVYRALRMAREMKFASGEGLALKNLGFHYSNSYVPDSARFYLDRALEVFQRTGDLTEQYHCLIEYTRFENLEGNFSRAMGLSEDALQLARTLRNGAMMSDALQRRATIHMDRGEYKNTVASLIEAARILDTTQPAQPVKKAIITVGIGRAELLGDDYQAAIPYFEEGLDVFHQYEETRWLAITYIELGSAYFQLEDYDAALEEYGHSLQISRDMGWNDFIAANLSNIGAAHMERGSYGMAISHFREANDIASKRGSINNLIIGYNDMGSTYYLMKRYPEAAEQFTRAIQLADSIGSLDNLSDAYLERGETYEKMGLATKALDDFKMFQTLKDSVFNIEKSNQIEALKTEYETEKKEQQLAIQAGEIALLEQEAKVGNLQRMLLGGGLLLALIGFYGIRQKYKRNRLEKDKVDAELAFKKKELTTHALHLAKKNEVLEGLKERAKELQAKAGDSGYRELIRTINFDQQDDRNWENFTQYFESVHKDFSKNVRKRFPEVTKNELRLMALLKMNMSSKEIATILNISADGVKKARQRLRKKMSLNPGESLEATVSAL